MANEAVNRFRDCNQCVRMPQKFQADSQVQGEANNVAFLSGGAKGGEDWKLGEFLRTRGLKHDD